MGALVMTVALDRPLLKDTYWVNVPKAEGLPFLVLVEHTNMIDPDRYGGDHLLYLGDYLEPSHRYFSMSQEELLGRIPARPYPASTPTSTRTGSQARGCIAPPMRSRSRSEATPTRFHNCGPRCRGLYFASMSQVYPWDRGTNYAVEIGKKGGRYDRRGLSVALDRPAPPTHLRQPCFQKQPADHQKAAF